MSYYFLQKGDGSVLCVICNLCRGYQRLLYAWRTSFCSLSVCENGFHFQLTTNCLNIFLLNITSVSHQEISYTLNIAESCAFDIIKRLVFKFKVVQSNRILSLGRKWHQYDAGMPCQIVKLHGTA